MPIEKSRDQGLVGRETRGHGEQDGGSVSAQKKGALADSQHKARFLTFGRNDKRCCHSDRREESLAPGIIEFPRIIEWKRGSF